MPPQHEPSAFSSAFASPVELHFPPSPEHPQVLSINSIFVSAISFSFWDGHDGTFNTLSVLPKFGGVEEKRWVEMRFTGGLSASVNSYSY